MNSGAHRMLLAASLSIAAAASAGCQSQTQTQEEEQMQTSESSSTSQMAAAAETERAARTASVPAETPEAASASSALTNFSLKLAGEAFQRSERGQNVVLSPWSVNSALSLVVAGANNETWTELVNGMGYETATLNRQREIVEGIAALNAELMPSEDASVALTSANRAWLEESVAPDLVDEYRSLLSDTLHSPIATADFRNDAPAQRNVINEWISNETNAKIPELLPEGSVAEDTNLVLTNAVYFLADWATPFREELTEDKVFYLADNEGIEVPTMRQSYSAMTTWRSENYIAVSIPYQDREFAMVVYLPAAGKYDDFEQLLRDGERGAILPDDRQTQRVNLQMPRTEIRWASSMKDALNTLGISSAFTGEADFTRMFQDENVALTDVYHEAFMRIDEQGTEAAAATGAMVSATSMPTSQPLNFTVDRPYYVMVVNTAEWAPLFMAKISDPRYGDAAPADDESPEEDIVR